MNGHDSFLKKACTEEESERKNENTGIKQFVTDEDGG